MIGYNVKQTDITCSSFEFLFALLLPCIIISIE